MVLSKLNALSLLLSAPLAVGVVMLTAYPAQADLRICNKSKKPLTSAIAYHNTARNTWTTEGWWAVEPGKCATPIKGTLRNRYYYIYAHTNDDSIIWDGEHKFYVNSSVFTIGDAESGEGERQEGFFEVDTKSKGDFTQNLLPPSN